MLNQFNLSPIQKAILKAQGQGQGEEFKMKSPIILQNSKRYDHFMKLLMERCTHIPNAKKPICEGSQWEAADLLEYEELHSALGQCFGITHYKNSLELVTAEQMMDFYATIGMPVMYDHPDRGKAFLQTKHAYDTGQQGLAYELVINTNPCVSLNMLENSAAMQSLVIAHAAIGHNSFFKNNKMFVQWTDADNFLDYLRYARDYIKRCEERVGVVAVEQFITSCKAIENYGVDRYQRKSTSKINAQETDRLKKMQENFEKNYDPVFASAAEQNNEKAMLDRMRKNMGEKVDFSNGGHENVLYCIEKLSPAALSSQLVNNSPWMVEITRIMRKIAQYFYPQKQTQLMNEGWASFWHYALNHIAWKKGYITNTQMAEILESHTGVVRQDAYNSPYYSGFNVYRLGWEMYLDIMFAADGPQTVEEQKYYDEHNYAETFANIKINSNGKRVPLIGSNWVDALHYAMENHRDDEFVSTFLSPAIAKKFGMFSIRDSDASDYLEIIGTQADFETVRTSLSNQYSLSRNEADISVVAFDPYGDQVFYLKHTAEDGRPLNKEHTQKVMEHINVLLRGPRALGTKAFRNFRAEIETVDTRDPEKPVVTYYSKRPYKH